MSQILGCKLDNISTNQAVSEVLRLLNFGNNCNIFFINADCLYKAQYDIEYRKILNSADIVLPDGIGLKLISNFLGKGSTENCNGSDLCPLLFEKISTEGRSLFFLGGNEGVAKAAAENVKNRIQYIKIAGTYAGYFTDDEPIIKAINSSGADVLFVGMGAPLQEKWIYKNRSRLNPKLCLGVGALFDYLSGRIPRAPFWMRKMHLEWLWRIFMEPKRMFKRYAVDGSKLFWIVLKERFKKKTSS